MTVHITPDYITAEKLHKELLNFDIFPADKYSDFTINQLFNNIINLEIIKQSNKRRVYYIQTAMEEFFLKISLIIRRKDRFRHKVLPWRRWAEWRNLHKLNRIGINAAEPVLRGENRGQKPHAFFILTRKITGNVFNEESPDDFNKLGRYIALLHSKGVYFADFHPGNLIIDHDSKPHLIDVQEIYFWYKLPRFLRINNLGLFFSHLKLHKLDRNLIDNFLFNYNLGLKKPVRLKEIILSVSRYQKRRFYSRSKRCCMNSSEFIIVKNEKIRGFKKRDFSWTEEELFLALKKGDPVKKGRVLTFMGVCIKKRDTKLFQKDKSLISWKMSRQMEIIGIPVPKGLGYFKTANKSFFLSEFLSKGILLNGYLSSIVDWQKKRDALRELALWLKKIHDHNVWQKDFKSSNVLCVDDKYFMIDLDSVRVHPLSEKKKIINLAQLNASLSNAISCKDRIRFFLYYSEGKISKQKQRSIYKKIISITLTKNTSLFGLNTAMFKFK